MVYHFTKCRLYFFGISVASLIFAPVSRSCEKDGVGIESKTVQQIREKCKVITLVVDASAAGGSTIEIDPRIGRATFIRSAPSAFSALAPSKTTSIDGVDSSAAISLARLSNVEPTVSIVELLVKLEQLKIIEVTPAKHVEKFRSLVLVHRKDVEVREAKPEPLYRRWSNPSWLTEKPKKEKAE